MAIYNTPNEYGTVTKTFHWVIFLLVVTMLCVGFFLGSFSKEMRPIVMNVHKLTGLLILLLMTLRLFWSLINIKPILVFTSWWEKFLERTVHWLIYAAVIGMPLFGWIGSTAAGRAPHLGALTLPIPFVDKNDALKEWAFHWHNIFAYLLVGLLTIHVGAAFFHHFIRQDNVLRRMVPKGWV